jgi:hypothetical protein
MPHEIVFNKGCAGSDFIHVAVHGFKADKALGERDNFIDRIDPLVWPTIVATIILHYFCSLKKESVYARSFIILKIAGRQ